MPTALTSTTAKPAAPRGGSLRPTMSAPVATNPSGAASGRPAGAANANAWACLVLAGDPQRRASFERSAKAAGWAPITCSSIGEAARQHRRWRTQLAAIDFGSTTGPARAALQQFAEQIAAPERLLLICDEPADAQGELWARQVGAWVYLPSPEFGDGLVDLFNDARQAAEKLAGSDDAGAVPAPASPEEAAS